MLPHRLRQLSLSTNAVAVLAMKTTVVAAGEERANIVMFTEHRLAEDRPFRNRFGPPLWGN
jgi:hypothetical protein